MNIKMTNKEGITLFTQGKYCKDNIQVIPAFAIGTSGMPIVVTSAEKMAEILTNATPEDYGKIYLYTGTTTADYKQGAYYLLEEGSPESMRRAGIYETGTDNLLVPWEDLLADGSMVVDDGTLSVGSVIPSTFAVRATPALNEYGFYFNIPYSHEEGFAFVFYEDGSFDMINGDNVTNNPAGSAVYSENAIYVNEFGVTFEVINNGTALTDGDYILQGGEKYAIVGDLALPNDGSITNFANSVFKNQTSLTGIVIPDTIVSIGDEAFSGCESLTTVEIPNIVSYIGYNAFYECNALQDIQYKGTESEWESINIGDGNEVFNNITVEYAPAVKPVIKGAGLYKTGSNFTVLKTSWEDLLAEGAIVVNDGAINIGMVTPELPAKNQFGFYFGVPYSDGYYTYTFYEDGSIDECEEGYEPYRYPAGTAVYSENTIYFSEYDWTLNVVDDGMSLDDGEYAYRIGSLYRLNGDLVLPDDSSITIIPDNAFNRQTSLTGISIPNCITSIGYGAFSSCYNLVKINYMGTIDQWAEIVVAGIESNPLYNGSRLYVNSDLVTAVNLTEVSRISNYVFANYKALKEVNISGSVESIGEQSFYTCEGLTSVTIDNGTTAIGNEAFAYCINLINATLDVASIGKNAFYRCDNLTNVDLGDNVTSIDEQAFRSCKSLTSIELPEGLTSIGLKAFESCTGLTSIEFPGSLTSIGKQVISGCNNLTSVKVNNGVTSLPSGIFSGPALTEISLPFIGETKDGTTSNTYFGYIFGAISHTSQYIYIPSSLTKVILVDGATSIPANAFYGCNTLTAIQIPASLTSIGDGAFNKCNKLKSLYIDDIAAWCNVTRTGFYSTPGGDLYLNNELITNLVIPHGVTNIKRLAFGSLKSLITAVVPDGVITIENSVFGSCDNLTSVEIADSVTSMGTGVFSGCLKLTSVKLSNSLISIPENAFYYCQELTDVTIPASVTSISKNAFYGCMKLPSIVIPSGVTSIGEGAFYSCSKITSINIPEGVTMINQETFSGCSSLTSIDIPDGVTSIGNKAFYGCSALTSINIPASVITIGGNVFKYCSNLASITVNSTTPSSLGAYAFDNISADAVIYVPAESVDTYKAANGWRLYADKIQAIS